MDLHQKARLGPTDDKKKGKLAKDARLKTLRDLASVNLMPTQQFRQLENDLLNMKTCYQLAANDLDATSWCPHCDYRPSDEPLHGAPPASRLEQIDGRLDRLVEEWSKTLLENLDDPTIKGQVGLIASADGKKAVEQFRKSRKLPEPVTPAFLKALQEVFSGLEKVPVTEAGIRAALSKGGLPCTLDEAGDRLQKYLSDVTKGKDPSRVRIVLEEA